MNIWKKEFLNIIGFSNRDDTYIIFLNDFGEHLPYDHSDLLYKEANVIILSKNKMMVEINSSYTVYGKFSFIGKEELSELTDSKMDIQLYRYSGNFYFLLCIHRKTKPAIIYNSKCNNYRSNEYYLNGYKYRDGILPAIEIPI